MSLFAYLPIDVIIADCKDDNIKNMLIKFKQDILVMEQKKSETMDFLIYIGKIDTILLEYFLEHTNSNYCVQTLSHALGNHYFYTLPVLKLSILENSDVDTKIIIWYLLFTKNPELIKKYVLALKNIDELLFNLILETHKFKHNEKCLNIISSLHEDILSRSDTNIYYTFILNMVKNSRYYNTECLLANVVEYFDTIDYLKITDFNVMDIRGRKTNWFFILMKHMTNETKMKYITNYEKYPDYISYLIDMCVDDEQKMRMIRNIKIVKNNKDLYAKSVLNYLSKADNFVPEKDDIIIIYKCINHYDAYLNKTSVGDFYDLLDKIENVYKCPRKCMYILLKNKLTKTNKIVPFVQRLFNKYGVKIRPDIFEHITPDNCRSLVKTYPYFVENHNIKLLDSLIVTNKFVMNYPKYEIYIEMVLPYIKDNDLIEIYKNYKKKKYYELVNKEIRRRKLNN